MNTRVRFLSFCYLLSVFFIVPLLHLYNLPGTNINFMNVGLVIILILCVCSRFFYPKITVDTVYLPLLIYIPLQTIYACLMYDIDTIALILSAGQYVAFFVLLAFFNTELFDVSFARKSLFIIATISCIYIIVQAIAATFLGIYIGAGIPFLEVSNDIIANYTDAVTKYDIGYRPRSFFSEPAMFCTYVLLAFIISLYELLILKQKSSLKYLQISLYISGILVSRSSLGILTVVFICFCFISYYNIHSGIKLTFTKILFAGFLIVGGILLLQTSIVQDQITRLFYNDLLNEPRLKFLNDLNSTYYTNAEIFFGHDFKLLTYSGEFLPSFFRQFYCFGLIGEILLIIFLFKIFIRLTLLQRFILISFVFQMIGSELLHGGNFLLYFSWLLPIKKYEDYYRNKEENTKT